MTENSKAAFGHWFIAIISLIIMFAYLTTCGSTESIAQKQFVKDGKPYDKVNGSKRVSDTIPTYIIRVPVVELQKSMDSLNLVVSYVGRSLSVDQSEDVKRLYARMMNTILRNVSLDSTTVPKSKK